MFRFDGILKGGFWNKLHKKKFFKQYSKSRRKLFSYVMMFLCFYATIRLVKGRETLLILAPERLNVLNSVTPNFRSLFSLGGGWLGSGPGPC